MLRITAVSAGAVDYLLRGSGCAEHQHAITREQEQEHSLEVEAGQRQLEQDGPGYYLQAVQHGEAPGVWGGKGLSMLGISAGALASEDTVRKVFGELRHPDTGEFLGRPPRRFKSVTERIQEALAREPEANPERRREIELQVTEAARDTRKAVAYYDLTFSPAKSVSIYYAALVAAGATEAAEQVRAAHHAAIDAAMEYTERHAAYTRTGYHGRTADGRSVGRYEEAEGLIWTRWDHSTNREQEPQLHSHVAVLNRVKTCGDGKIRALDGAGFRPIKEAIEAIYTRTLEQRLEAELGVTFALRPDGKAREILGVDPELCAEASTRRRQVLERVEQLVTDYVEKHGREPSPQVRKQLAQIATLDTRAAKQVSVPPQQQYEQWAADKLDRLQQTLQATIDATMEVAELGHPDRRRGHQTLEEVLHAAVQQVQSQYSAWTVGNLTSAIKEQLDRAAATVGTDHDLEQLAAQVLTRRAEFGILQLTAPEPVEVPRALQRADGRSVFRPHIDERYATREQLGLEERIVIGARQLTAPYLAGEELELLQVELAANGLGEDQIRAILGVLGSGRATDVLIGPAGTGKSHTVGALAQVWQQRFGGRVLGLATSERATQVLREDGLEAVNTTQFLLRFCPDEQGRVRDQLQPGDLIIVDESGMSSTRELAQIAQLVEDSGGKLLYTGDYRQLAAVGAGGMLELLVTDTGAFELQEIRRFRHEWERDASARLRVGDVSVLREYQDRGRLHGGTLEQMQQAAVRAYLADILAGRESLLVVRSNAEAAQLSQQVHDELVRLGRVQPEVLAQLRDGTTVSAGDLIQARRNAPDIPLNGPGMVTNRETYTVLGRDESGGLRVQRADGAVAVLPADYVAEHVTLAYASTVHAAQGRTVDTAHALVDSTVDRESVYVALSRGRDGNYAYTITERAPDEHQVERLQATPTEVMASALALEGRQETATAQLRAGLAAAESLAVVGTLWDEVVREYARDRYSDILLELLGPERMDVLAAEHGYQRLMRSIREAELTGHRPEALLREVVDAREIDSAESMTDVLRWRIRQVLPYRQPEQQVDLGNWTTLSAPLDGPIGQYAHELAVLASDRQAELGRRVAEEQPEWALVHLGPVPEEPMQREEWIRRAGIAAAYRELRGLPEDSLSLGAAPSREQEFHRALWLQAHAALGSPAEAMDYYTATDAELRELRARWEREQTWAPPYVAEELQIAYLLADSYRQDAVLYRAELEQLDPQSPAYAEAVAQIETAERLAAQYAERAAQIEEIHAARARWVVATEQTRMAAELAAEELQRRGVPLQVERPEPEQLALFPLDPERPEPASRPQPEAARPAEQYQVEAEQRAAQPVLEQVEQEVSEPAERVRWWQRWAARLGWGRQPEPEVEPVVERPMQDAEREQQVEAEPAQASYTPALPQPEQAAEPAPEQAGVDPNQPALFDLEPTVTDVVQAQPLRQDTTLEQEDLALTLAEARRQARAAEQLRLQRDAAEQQRRTQQAHRARVERLEAERQRRDVAERDMQRTTDRGREQQVQREQEPQIERVPQRQAPAVTSPRQTPNMADPKHHGMTGGLGWTPPTWGPGGPYPGRGPGLRR